MALVFKLALFATSKTVFCLNNDTETFSSPREVASFAAEQLQGGNLSAAESAFTKNFQKFSNNPSFQYEYISFMIRIGQYDKILDLKVEGETNNKLIEKTKAYKKTIESMNMKEICSLVSISPISLDVNIAMIQSLILDKKLGQADKYLSFALRYYPDSTELFYLKAYMLLAFGKHEEAMVYFQNPEFNKGRKLSDLLIKYREYSKIKDPNVKMQYLMHLYKEVLISKMSSSEVINIYEPIYKQVIELIVKNGCENQMGVASFASILKELEPSDENLLYFIKALIFENRFEEAKREIDNNKFGEAVRRYLNSFYALKLKEFNKRIQEREEREERKRRERRRMQEEQQNFGGFETKNAGKDFLNYYKILGVDKTATPEALKKAHRKKVREATKNAAKNKANLPADKREEELKMVNKAFQILSDPQKKKTYDMGIDPETGPQPSQHGNFHYRGGQENIYFDEETIQDVFKTFFGGGHQRSGRGHQRAQFIFL